MLCFSLSFWNIDAPTRKISFLEEFCSNNNPGFFFSCNNSRVFKIVLKDWNESEGNFNLAQAILKFPEDSFQSWRTILKTREMLQVKKKSGSFGTKCWGKLIPQRQSIPKKIRLKSDNYIFVTERQLNCNWVMTINYCTPKKSSCSSVILVICTYFIPLV